MNGTIIKVEGLEALKKKFKQLPQTVTVALDAELHAISEEYVNKAVSMAPRDQGQLVNGISANHETLNHEIVSMAPQSAPLEFGTRSRVQIPAGLEAYAAKFKGMKTSGDAKKNIFDWCKRHGIPEEARYPIFIKIMTIGINPHPFFFPHLPWAQSEVKKRSKQVIQKALK